MEQDLLTLPEHLRSPLVFGGVRVVYSLVFYVVSCVHYYCLSFCPFHLAMALSVYFRFMSLTVPLVSFVPLSYDRYIQKLCQDQNNTLNCKLYHTLHRKHNKKQPCSAVCVLTKAP